MNLPRNHILVSLTACMAVMASPAPPAGFDHHANIVADVYDLYWSVQHKEIHFEVQVKTLGYVGFGISPNGGMAGADIVTGWVKDDLVYFQDRFATRNALPAIDEEQNWFAIEGREIDGYTIIRFKRPIISCDKENDMDVTGETMRLIYSFHPDDPEDEASLVYHGNERRGTKSVTLILHDTAKDPDSIPQHNGYVDFLNPNFTIPAKETTYWCLAFKMPDLDEKHQIVRIEPIIQDGNEGTVHHILLYACYHEFDEDEHDGLGAECYMNLMGEVEKCTAVIGSWAIGGKAINFPLHVGYPIGKGHPPTMIKMETHYDNPAPSQSGIVDASGLRLYYTNTLREYDAGLLEMGAQTDGSLIIPPKFDSYISQSHCTSSCLSAAIPEEEDMKVFGVLLHSHLLGTRITVRHVRDGTELPPLAKDDYYDFNYQDFRILPEERVIKPKDSLIIECDYESSERASVTFGGLSTEEEMCLAYVFHYPKRAFSRCLSGPVPYHIVQFVNPTIEIDRNDPNFYHELYNFYITAPEEFALKSYRQILREIDWNDAEWRDRYEENMMKTGVTAVQYCNDGYQDDLLQYPFFEVPEVKEVYVAPEPECYELLEESSGYMLTGSILMLPLVTLLHLS